MGDQSSLSRVDYDLLQWKLVLNAVFPPELKLFEEGVGKINRQRKRVIVELNQKILKAWETKSIFEPIGQALGFADSSGYFGGCYKLKKRCGVNFFLSTLWLKQPPPFFEFTDKNYQYWQPSIQVVRLLWYLCSEASRQRVITYATTPIVVDAELGPELTEKLKTCLMSMEAMTKCLKEHREDRAAEDEAVVDEQMKQFWFVMNQEMKKGGYVCSCPTYYPDSP